MTHDELIALQQVNELKLTDAEEARMTEIFEQMKNHEDVLKAYDTENVEVMVFVNEMTNVLREDKRVQDFSREELLEGAPEHTEDSWQVPRLVK